MAIEGKAVWLSEKVINRAKSYARNKFGKLPRDMSMNTILTEVFNELDNNSKIHRLI